MLDWSFKMELVFACFLVLRVIPSSGSAGIAHLYGTPYGSNAMSAKPNMAILTDLSRIQCAQMCNIIRGCGGFNYRVASTGLLQCELKQATTDVKQVREMPNVTYHEKKEQDPSIVSADCIDLRNAGMTASGVYQVNLNTDGTTPELTDVYCDMDTDNGGWLVLLKREDGSVDFERDWSAYSNGFGKKSGEYWLGLANMNRITNTSKTYSLRVDITLFNGTSYYAKYEKFTIDPEAGGYILHVDGYSGNAGDALAYHDGCSFSTYDVDNDLYNGSSCATVYHCGFWFKACSNARPTGLYGENVENTNDNGKIFVQGIMWHSELDDSHPKYIDMKIRP